MKMVELLLQAGVLLLLAFSQLSILVQATILRRGVLDSQETNCEITEATYTFPISKDPKIWNLPKDTNLTDVPPTQLRGQFYSPGCAKRTHSAPVLLFLAGQHPGCRRLYPVPQFGDYPIDAGHPNDEGICEDGRTVVESYRGFDYLGRALAAEGFIVLSVDPLMLNRASGTAEDDTLNTARGRLLLRTIEELREWDLDANASVRALGFDVSQMADFDQIGLLGHSRGGAGVRIAANLLNTPDRLPVKERYNWKAALNARIAAVAEVAPYPNREQGVWTAVVGAAWVVVAAGCEEDLKEYVYLLLAQRQSRLNRAPNYFINAYGATHQFFNTEWKEAIDSCIGDQDLLWNTSAPHVHIDGVSYPLILGSEKQRRLLEYVAKAFFMGHVGRNANMQNAASLAVRLDDHQKKSPESVADIPFARSNLNIARSTILQPFNSREGVLVNRTPKSSRLFAEHAADQISSFRNDVVNFQWPPNFLQQGAADPATPIVLSNKTGYEAGLVISISKEGTTSITLPLKTPISKSQSIVENCTIHIDVARRDPCFIRSPAAEKKTCPKPRIRSVQASAGRTVSVKLDLRSRYSVEFGLGYNDNDPSISQDLDPVLNNATSPNADEPGIPTADLLLTLLPVSWETIVLKCPANGTNSVMLEVMGPDGQSEEATESFLYIGPIRRT